MTITRGGADPRTPEEIRADYAILLREEYGIELGPEDFPPPPDEAAPPSVLDLDFAAALAVHRRIVRASRGEVA